MGLFDGLFDNFGSDFEQGFAGTDNLQDFTHASRLFRTDAFALAPNTKFLFHVYFTLNPLVASKSTSDRGLVGALVKSVQLPSFELDTQEYIQYNRKRNVHNRIKYRPVQIKLHDDSSDTVRSMWYNYYQYYFADSDYPYDGPVNGANQQGNGMAYNGRNIYNDNYTHNQWGVTTKSSQGNIKPAFFKDIKIFGFSRKNYISYTLVNPMIASWTHDTYDYSQGNGTMEHTMELKYEAVKYGRGKVADGIPGFGAEAPQRYDTSPSPMSKPGSTASIFGQSGLLDTVTGTSEDLASGNILGAAKKVFTQYKSFKDAPGGFKQVLEDDVLHESKKQLPNIIQSLSNKSGALFPKANKNQSPKQIHTMKIPTPTGINGGTNG